MSNPIPDYYAVLGLKPSATQEEIKKRYRELARQFHPDVNPSPEAAVKIKSVNEANRILGDVDRRSRYDAEIALNPPKTTPPAPPQAAKPQKAQKPTRETPRRAAPTQPPPRRNTNPFNRASTGPTSSERPAPTQTKVEFDGFGRTYSTQASSPPRAASSSPGSSSQSYSSARPERQNSAQANRTAAHALISQAEVAFLTRNYGDAERLCRAVLSIDRTSSAAHEILGDIFSLRGEIEDAVKSYSFAIQLNPQNYSIQGKLDRLIGRGPTRVRPSHVSGRGATKIRNDSGRARVTREVLMMFISIALFAGGCGALATFAQNPGYPIGSAIPWITSLSTNLIVTLGVLGIVGGVLLAFYGRLRPITEELSDRSMSPNQKSAPLLPILTILSIVWFYGSLMVYTGLTVRRNRFSMSIVRIYALSLAITALVTIMAATHDTASIGWLETAAFSGNIVFSAALAGWFLGDCVRLRVR